MIRSTITQQPEGIAAYCSGCVGEPNGTDDHAPGDCAYGPRVEDTVSAIPSGPSADASHRHAWRISRSIENLDGGQSRLFYRDHLLGESIPVVVETDSIRLIRRAER